MLNLYEFPPTRSQRAKWVLEELGLDYTSTMVDLTQGGQNTDAYRVLHPLAAVPALETDDYTMFESVAIVLQLVDEQAAAGLAPAPATAGRAHYYQWCIFAAAEVDPALMLYFDNALRPLEFMRPPGTLHDADLAARGKRDFATRAGVLSKALDGRDFLLGETFSGADIAVGHSCFMAALMGLLADFPVLVAYHDRLRQRPAYQRAYPA